MEVAVGACEGDSVGMDVAALAAGNGVKVGTGVSEGGVVIRERAHVTVHTNTLINTTASRTLGSIKGTIFQERGGESRKAKTAVHERWLHFSV